MRERHGGWWLAVLAVASISVAWVSTGGGPVATSQARTTARGVLVTVADAPGGPPVSVCGNTGVLTGPSSPPPGAVTVPAGDDSALSPTPHTTYWFAPGLHTVGSGPFGQIAAATGDTFIGGPGAVISGQGVNQLAFTGDVEDVTIEYLTIQDFVPPSGQGAVNASLAGGWDVEYDTIASIGNLPESGDGAGLMLASGEHVEHDCLSNNGTAGAQTGGQSVGDLTVSDDEISFNGIALFPVDDCGCAAGVKTFTTTGATFTNNYVHDNYGTGLWVDTDNAGWDIEDNDFARNYSNALTYEISYNALIANNLFVDNGWGSGSRCDGCDFPYGSAVYLSNSGGDPTVDGGIDATLQVRTNSFVDNWGGVVVYQDPDRFCGSGTDGRTCTLTGSGGHPTYKQCKNASGRKKAPLFTTCQWRAARIDISDNTFSFDPTQIRSASDTLPDIVNSNCYTGSNYLDTVDSPPGGNGDYCGFSGMFASYGTIRPYGGDLVGDLLMAPAKAGAGARGPAIAADNVFCANTYSGPWAFQAYMQGPSPAYTATYPRGIMSVVTAAGWQSVWGQDAPTCAPGG